MKKTIESAKLNLDYTYECRELFVSDICVKISTRSLYDEAIIEITDLANAAKVGKSCVIWTISQKHDPKDWFLSPPSVLNAVCGSSDIVEAVQALRSGNYSEKVDNIEVRSRECKGVNVFSPFASVKPVKVPTKWTISHIWKAIYTGQIVAAHRDYRYTDDYAYDAASNFGEGDLSGEALAELAEEIIEDGYSGWWVHLNKIDENGRYIIDLGLHSFEGWTLVFDQNATCGIVETRRNLGVDDEERFLTLAADFTTDTDPDDDPTPTDPTPSPDSDTTYSEFDKAFRACNIISISFGGAQNSAADRELTFSEMPDPAPRKKLTEKTWKMQLAAKADFEAAEKAARQVEIAEKLTEGAELSDGTTIASVDKCDDDGNILEVKYWLFTASDGACYDIEDFENGKISVVEPAEPEHPDENQLTFDDIAYSTKETSELVAYSTIDEDAARRGLESYSFSDYKPGSATAAYRAQVDEVLGVAAEVKQQLPKEYHAELDRLTARYAAKLADWTNRKNRADAAYPSCMIAGPANYNMRKHEKQMQRLDNLYAEYGQITALENRIKNFADEINHRPIKAGDSGTLDKLRAKVNELTKLQEKMKQANSEARKNDAEAPYPAWALSNNRQNLKRYADRLSELEKAKSAPTEQTEDGGDGYRIVRNADIMRLQIIFDDKPDADTRNTLKKNGFKWAPSQGAWQRQLNNNGEYALKSVIKAISK